MPLFDELVAANKAYVADGRHRPLPVRPARELAVVTCMDSRIDVFAVLGLDLGDAHVLRTAGARLSDDMLRSLHLSTHVLGMRSVAIVGHTRCGLHDEDGSLPATLRGLDPGRAWWGDFRDPKDAIRSDCGHLLAWPGQPPGMTVAGYLLDVDTGGLEEVVPPARAAEV